MPIPALSAAPGCSKRSGRPSSRTRPSSGAWMPASSLPSVLLPAPFSPQRAWHEPASTSKLTPSSATTPGKRLPTPSKRISGGMSGRELLCELHVLVGHVGEAPVPELLGPGPEVVLGDADELHRDHLGDLLLEDDLVHDRLDALVAPEVRALGEEDRSQPLLDVGQLGG